MRAEFAVWDGEFGLAYRLRRHAIHNVDRLRLAAEVVGAPVSNLHRAEAVLSEERMFELELRYGRSGVPEPPFLEELLAAAAT